MSVWSEKQIEQQTQQTFDVYTGVPEYIINPLSRCFIYIYTRQTSGATIIEGRRGTGKTNKVGLCFEILNKYKDYTKFAHFASNVTFEEPLPFPIEKITNLEDLRFWADNNKGKKIFGFDEVQKGMRRRTPMGSLNIELLEEFTELRKSKLSLIATTIDEKYVDKAFLGDDLLDGYFVCPMFNNPKVMRYVDFLENFDDEWTNIPKCTLNYNTFAKTPFTLKSPNSKPKFSDKDQEVLWKWSNGSTAKELGLERTQIARITKKFIKEVLERDSNK